MAYEFYKAYVNSMAQTPLEDWREGQQEAINDFWDNTSTVTTIQGQTAVGSKTYTAENIQLNSVINPTTGENFGDQYRKIIYQTYANATTNKWLGKMYSFDNNTWLTINTNTKIGANTSSVLRQCNNYLKWIDNNGILHNWECVFTRNISGTSLDYGSEGTPQVEGDCKILVQQNDNTSQIVFNQRFLFDHHAYQVKQIDNHYSKTLLTLYIFETQIQTNDDVENNIAGNGISTSGIIISPNVAKIDLGQSQQYAVYKYVNGFANTDTFTVTASQAPPNTYTLAIDSGNTFTITNNKQTDIPLVITCVNNTSGEIGTVTITLGGVW